MNCVKCHKPLKNFAKIYFGKPNETAKVDFAVEVRQQPHYTNFKIQPAVFIGENRLSFFEGNIIKYVCRATMKDGVKDLYKARHYLDMLIQQQLGEPIKP